MRERSRFRKRKNEAVHRSEIMKTYVLLDKVDSGVLTLFEEIQFEVIETSQKIIVMLRKS